jgi:2-aminoadipate transaminase
MAASVIDLTRGSPPVSVFPIEDLVRCCETALRQHGNVLLQYSRSPGFAPMREWLAARHGVPASQVFMGNSSLEILDFISHILLEKNKRVFVEVPTYDRTLTLLRRHGAELVGIPLQEDGVDLQAFESELRRGVPAFVYLIPDFQNPTGITTSLIHRRQMAAWAEQFGFWIIEDGPYRPLRYMGEELPTIHSLAPQRVMHMSSLSKQLAPGLRLGYLLGSEEIVKELSAWAVNTYIGPVTLAQGAAYEYCRQGLLDANIEKLKTIYRPRLEAVLSALDKHLPGVHFSPPSGGYYVSLTLPEGNRMDDLLAKAGGAGLKLSDGRGFFIHPPLGDHFLRIPFCSVSEEDLEQAVVNLKGILV